MKQAVTFIAAREVLILLLHAGAAHSESRGLANELLKQARPAELSIHLLFKTPYSQKIPNCPKYL